MPLTSSPSCCAFSGLVILIVVVIDYKSLTDCSNFNFAGISTHLTDVIVNNSLMDLDERGTSSVAQQNIYPDSTTKTSNKKRKHASTSSSLDEQCDKDVFEVEVCSNMASLSVKIAALEALEALLAVVCLMFLSLGTTFEQMWFLRDEIIILKIVFKELQVDF